MSASYHVTHKGIKLAYVHTAPSEEGAKLPAVVFLGGFKSDMAGTKAIFLQEECKKRGQEFLRFDYSGHGQSEGAFADGTISIWKNDAIAVIDDVLQGRDMILVGSSMGGWLMLLVGEALGDQLAGLVGIAAAPDFSDWGFSEEQKTKLSAGETIYEDNPYGPEPTPTHALFWNDAEQQRKLSGTIAIDCPVHLLHGQRDADVPWEISLKLAEALRSDAVKVTLVKDGDHRLSREGDIALLLQTVESLCLQHETNP